MSESAREHPGHFLHPVTVSVVWFHKPPPGIGFHSTSLLRASQYRYSFGGTDSMSLMGIVIFVTQGIVGLHIGKEFQKSLDLLA